jgi:16S rRNA (cytidine1402-2'-O)-methyltransferase
MSAGVGTDPIYAKLPDTIPGSISTFAVKLIWGIPVAGKLYIVGTPIGNLEDISARAARTLKEVDLIFAEDTRVSVKLLSHLGISKTLVSCHDANESVRADELAKHASAGASLALISDAGMPLISDPGYKLVRRAIELGMEIICIPGPCSLTASLAGSGLPCERFSFEGFLPEKTGERRRRLEKLRDDDRTLVFFLPLQDLEKILGEINEVMGNRQAALCREITKLHEEYIRASVRDILEIARQRVLKGECVLVLAGASSQSRPASESEICDRLQQLLDAGARLKDAAGLMARETGWSSSDIYKLGLKLRDPEKKR